MNTHIRSRRYATRNQRPTREAYLASAAGKAAHGVVKVGDGWAQCILWGLASQEEATALASLANLVDATTDYGYIPIPRPPCTFRLPKVGDFVIDADFPLHMNIDALHAMVADVQAKNLGDPDIRHTLAEIVNRVRNQADTLPIEMVLDGLPLPLRRVGAQKPAVMTLVMEDVDDGDDDDDDDEAAGSGSDDDDDEDEEEEDSDNMSE